MESVQSVMEVAWTFSTVSPAVSVKRESGENVTDIVVPAVVPAIDYADTIILFLLPILQY